MKRLLTANRLIFIGAGLAMLYWLSEALFIDVLVFGEELTYREMFLPEELHELVMRIEVVILLILFSIYGQDIVNRRKRAEEAQVRLSSIVQNSSDAVDSKTLDGTIISLNPSAEKLYGYSDSGAHKV